MEWAGNGQRWETEVQAKDLSKVVESSQKNTVKTGNCLGPGTGSLRNGPERESVADE